MFWLQKPVPRAGFSAKPSTPWLKLISQTLGEFKLELLSGNAQFGSKLAIFCPVWPWKFDGWPCKTTGHLFYATSSFVNHFVAIGEFKLELQSGNTQFGSKSMFFFSRVTSKFDGWPWKTIGHPFYVISSLVHHFKAIGKLKLTVTVRKRLFRVKTDNCYSRVTLKFDRWPWKTIGHIFYATSSFCIIL